MLWYLGHCFYAVVLGALFSSCGTWGTVFVLLYLGHCLCPVEHGALFLSCGTWGTVFVMCNVVTVFVLLSFGTGFVLRNLGHCVCPVECGALSLFYGTLSCKTLALFCAARHWALFLFCGTVR